MWNSDHVYKYGYIAKLESNGINSSIKQMSKTGCYPIRKTLELMVMSTTAAKTMG